MNRVLPAEHLDSARRLRRAAVETYWQDVRKYFVRRVSSGVAADDLAQEVCVRFLSSNVPSCPPRPLAYLYGIAGHVLADYRREQRRERAFMVSGSDLLEHGILGDNLRAQDPERDDLGRQQLLLQALSQLPAKHCSVLLAHQRDGLSYKETAEKLNLSVHTVEKYLTQAKAQLRLICRD